MDNLEEQLNFWGYTRVPGKTDPDFGFFDYGPHANEAHAANFEGFK